MGNFASSPQKLMLTTEKAFIHDLISNNCVVIFSKTHCIYCNTVKKLFVGLRVPFLNVELDKRADGSNLQAALIDITGAKTVPRVFINGECIGGAYESEQLHKQHKLLEKIHECSNKRKL